MSGGVGKLEFQSVGQNERRDTEVWVMDAQIHPFHELIVVMEGSQHVRIGAWTMRAT